MNNPTFPSSSPLIGQYQEPQCIEQLRCSADDIARIGLPGVGKTALAVALVP